MIKKFAKRLIKTYLTYRVMRFLNIDSPTGHGRIKRPYKAILKRIK